MDGDAWRARFGACRVTREGWVAAPKPCRPTREMSNAPKFCLRCKSGDHFRRGRRAFSRDGSASVLPTGGSWEKYAPAGAPGPARPVALGVRAARQTFGAVRQANSPSGARFPAVGTRRKFHPPPADHLAARRVSFTAPLGPAGRSAEAVELPPSDRRAARGRRSSCLPEPTRGSGDEFHPLPDRWTGRGRVGEPPRRAAWTAPRGGELDPLPTGWAVSGSVKLTRGAEVRCCGPVKLVLGAADRVSGAAELLRAGRGSVPGSGGAARRGWGSGCGWRSNQLGCSSRHPTAPPPPPASAPTAPSPGSPTPRSTAPPALRPPTETSPLAR
jgi:hypothetical protein